jgi:hypothetical protein
MDKFLSEDVMPPPIILVAILLALTETMEEDECQTSVVDSQNKAEAEVSNFMKES